MVVHVENGTAIQFTSNPSRPGSEVLARRHPCPYVRKHNLYIHPFWKREKQLTRDKDENILNGEVDWVYAEETEVAAIISGLPRRQLAFLQMDETRVPTYPMTDWLPTQPKVDLEKYPKAGDPNPPCALGCQRGRRQSQVDTSADEHEYLHPPRFGWVRNGLLWAQVLNRAQDKMELYFIDAHRTDPQGADRDGARRLGERE